MKNLPVLHVSPGNSKLGNIPNVSGVPGKDCINCKSCFSTCYARKAFRMYPSTRKAWEDNSALVRQSPEAWGNALLQWFLARKASPKFFRFNVAGDIVSKDHFRQMVRVARENPSTRFLVFTKAYQFARGECPDNLQIVFSVWEGMKPNKVFEGRALAFAGDCKAFGKAFEEAIRCPGNCETCGACWDLSRVGINVRFDIH